MSIRIKGSKHYTDNAEIADYMNNQYFDIKANDAYNSKYGKHDTRGMKHYKHTLKTSRDEMIRLLPERSMKLYFEDMWVGCHATLIASLMAEMPNPNAFDVLDDGELAFLWTIWRSD